MRILVVGGMLAVVNAAAQPAAPAASGDLLDRFLGEIKTLTAEFEQELVIGDEREVEFGSLAFERPSKFRWHYEAPFERLVIADGRNLWILDVDLEQATVTPLDDTVGSSPAMLLSGDRAIRDGFTVVDEYTAEGLDWVRLEPEIEAADFRAVLLGFDALTPRRLELVDGLGQITRIALSSVEVNVELDDGLFRFRRPRGVDVIGTPAR